MTVSLDDAEALARVAARVGRLLTIAHGSNYLEISPWAQDVIATGTLCRLTWVDAARARGLRGGRGRRLPGRGLLGDVGVAGEGGGYLYGQLTHQLGLVLSLVDSPPREAFARLALLDSGVDIACGVSVEFDNGVIGSFAGHGRMPWDTRGPFGVRLAR